MNVEERPFQDRVFAISCEKLFGGVCRWRRRKRENKSHRRPQRSQSCHETNRTLIERSIRNHFPVIFVLQWLEILLFCEDSWGPVLNRQRRLFYLSSLSHEINIGRLEEGVTRVIGILFDATHR